jgi:hypothetical protein
MSAGITHRLQTNSSYLNRPAWFTPLSVRQKPVDHCFAKDRTNFRISGT